MSDFPGSFIAVLSLASSRHGLGLAPKSNPGSPGFRPTRLNWSTRCPTRQRWIRCGRASTAAGRLVRSNGSLRQSAIWAWSSRFAAREGRGRKKLREGKMAEMSSRAEAHSTRRSWITQCPLSAWEGALAVPVFPPPPLKFRTAGFPQYGFKPVVNGNLHPHGLICRPSFFRPRAIQPNKGSRRTVSASSDSSRSIPVQWPLARRRVVLSRRVIAYYGLIRGSGTLPTPYILRRRVFASTAG